jgi:two-component system sensor histidine kinase AlgZ
MEETQNSQDRTGEARSFLPDFCSIKIVLMVIIIAELLAFLVVLSANWGGNQWDDLGITSLFIQWVALSSTAVLCVARKRLVAMNNTAAGILSYLIVLLVIVLLSEAAYWITIYIGFERTHEWHVAMVLRNLGIGAIVSAIALRMLYLQRQQTLHVESHANARIQALQARIRPHFLFNSMNTIAALIRGQPENAEEAVEDLSDLFRASLGDKNQVRLEDEVELIKRYLHIEKLRLGERLNVEWDLDHVPMDASVPALLLQPLLENAIYHGIENLQDGGTISITGVHENGLIKISIANPVTEQMQNNHVRQSNNMAMENIRERLAIAFERDGKLNMEKTSDRCLVDIMFPYKSYSPT